MFNGTENQLDHKLLHKIHSKSYTKRFILSVTSFWTYMYAYPELQFFQGIVILDANLITRKKKKSPYAQRTPQHATLIYIILVRNLIHQRTMISTPLSSDGADPTMRTLKYSPNCYRP